MTVKLSAGLLILFIALVLQFSSAAFGPPLNFAFAALISCAFIFDFWELLVLVLIGVFILNWQPKASVEILIFALYPLATYFSRNISQWQVWVKNLMAILLGNLILYLLVTGTLSPWRIFTVDTLAWFAFGAMVFSPLYRWEKS